MKIRSTKGQPEDPNAVDKVMDYTQKSYRSFMDYVALRDDDPIWMLIYKLAFRFVGLLFFIAISPFLILGLLVAVTAAF